MWRVEVDSMTYHFTLRDLHGLQLMSDVLLTRFPLLTSIRSATASSLPSPPARVSWDGAFDRPEDYRITTDENAIERHRYDDCDINSLQTNADFVNEEIRGAEIVSTQV